MGGFDTSHAFASGSCLFTCASEGRAPGHGVHGVSGAPRPMSSLVPRRLCVSDSRVSMLGSSGSISCVGVSCDTRRDCTNSCLTAVSLLSHSCLTAVSLLSHCCLTACLTAVSRATHTLLTLWVKQCQDPLLLHYLIHGQEGTEELRVGSPLS